MSNVVAYFTHSIHRGSSGFTFFPTSPSNAVNRRTSSNLVFFSFTSVSKTSTSGHFCSKSSTEAFRSHSSNNASIFSFPFLSFVVACETFFIAFCSCLCASARKPERDQSSMGFSPKVVGLFVVLLGVFDWNASSSFSEKVVVLFTRHGRRRRRRRRRRTSEILFQTSTTTLCWASKQRVIELCVTTSFFKMRGFCVSVEYLFNPLLSTNHSKILRIVIRQRRRILFSHFHLLVFTLRVALVPLFLTLF